MIWTIAIIFALLWVLGLVTAYTLGGFIHALLIVAIALVVVGAYKAGAAGKLRTYVGLARQAASDNDKAPKRATKK